MREGALQRWTLIAADEHDDHASYTEVIQFPAGALIRETTLVNGHGAADVALCFAAGVVLVPADTDDHGRRLVRP